MIKVAGAWELSWNSPIKECELWNFVLRDFEIKYWYMWPVSGVRNREQRNVQLIERRDLKEILDETQDLIHVFFEPQNPRFPHDGIDLRDFEHPKDALYIFGHNHYNPVIHYKKEEDPSVVIPTIQNKGVLWPHQCLAIILYDKLVKEWQ